MMRYDVLPPRSKLVWWAVGGCVAVGLAAIFGNALAQGNAQEVVATATSLSRFAWGAFIWVLIGYYGFRGRTSRDDRSALADSLADMLELDISLEEALRQQLFDFNDRLSTRFSATAWAIQRLANRVARGDALSDAVAQERGFPSYWAPLLRLAEKHGQLGEGLRGIATIERDADIFTAGLIVRPLVTMLMVGLVASFLSVYIMPTFVSLLEALGPAQDISRLASLKVIEPALGVLAVVLCALLARPARTGLTQLTGGLPGFWRITQFQHQGLVTSCLAAAMRLGQTWPETLLLASQVATSPSYRSALQAMASEHGDSLAQAFQRYPNLFSKPLVWMVAQAEALGTLPDVLATASAWFFDEAERTRIRLSTVLQVGLTVVVGLAVGYTCMVVMGMLTNLVTVTLARGLLPGVMSGGGF